MKMVKLAGNQPICSLLFGIHCCFHIFEGPVWSFHQCFGIVNAQAVSFIYYLVFYSLLHFWHILWLLQMQARRAISLNVLISIWKSSVQKCWTTDCSTLSMNRLIRNHSFVCSVNARKEDKQLSISVVALFFPASTHMLTEALNWITINLSLSQWVMI